MRRSRDAVRVRVSSGASPCNPGNLHGQVPGCTVVCARYKWREDAALSPGSLENETRRDSRDAALQHNNNLPKQTTKNMARISERGRWHLLGNEPYNSPCQGCHPRLYIIATPFFPFSLFSLRMPSFVLKTLVFFVALATVILLSLRTWYPEKAFSREIHAKVVEELWYLSHPALQTA